MLSLSGFIIIVTGINVPSARPKQVQSRFMNAGPWMSQIHASDQNPMGSSRWLLRLSVLSLKLIRRDVMSVCLSVCLFVRPSVCLRALLFQNPPFHERQLITLKPTIPAQTFRRSAYEFVRLCSALSLLLCSEYEWERLMSVCLSVCPSTYLHFLAQSPNLLGAASCVSACHKFV